MTVIRSRFAPSPTGYMHIGNLRTALYEFLIAKRFDGKFILRIEDTDQNRYVEDAVSIIYDTLSMVGLKHDEGPDIGGEYGPYTQSERLDIYKKYADMLVDLGGAHYCFCSEEDIEKQREFAEKAKKPFKFVDPCKQLSKEECRERIKHGEPYTVRQTIPIFGKTSFYDEVYGKIEVDNKTLDEGILLKSDGFPTYNFANIIDDHLMQISHVLRGSEYLSSTPKYNLIYQAFNWEIPTYVHLPPIMKDAHNKLSKRNGDASFQDLISKGYLPEAIINYIALLGWNPKNEREIFSLQDLISEFSIQGINKSPAIFDVEKLKWMNGIYIRQLSLEDFTKKAIPFYQKIIHRDVDFDFLSSVLQPRISTFSEILELVDFIDNPLEYDKNMFEHKKMKSTFETSLEALQKLCVFFEATEEFKNFNEFHDALMLYLEKDVLKTGQVFWPFRVALTGKQFTPGGALEVSFLLGKDETIRRIKMGILKIQG